MFYAACESNSDCPENHVCQDGVCYLTCQSKGDECGSHLACLSGGVCGVPCSDGKNDQCPLGTTCKDGNCEVNVCHCIILLTVLINFLIIITIINLVGVCRLYCWLGNVKHRGRTTLCV